MRDVSLMIDTMMNSIYSAQEARWEEERESDQLEYDIAMRQKPGPIQSQHIAQYMGWMTYNDERVSDCVVVKMKVGA